MTSDKTGADSAAAAALAAMKDHARAFAIAAHGAQRYGGHPYSHHLDAVAALVEPHGDEAVAIAYLHDAVEDTAATLAEIEHRFGPHVAACVALLTDEPGVSRKKRKAKTYAKLAAAQGSLELALLVKAADRLANVRACIADRKLDLLHVYRSEQAAFRKAACRPNLCEPFWAELDALLAEDAAAGCAMTVRIQKGWESHLQFIARRLCIGLLNPARSHRVTFLHFIGRRIVTGLLNLFAIHRP